MIVYFQPNDRGDSKSKDHSLKIEADPLLKQIPQNDRMFSGFGSYTFSFQFFEKKKLVQKFFNPEFLKK